MRRAARVGSIGIGCGLMYLVLYLPASLSLSAEIIDPGGPVAQKWRFWTTVLSGAVMVHVVAALSRGGKLRYFFWPFNFIWLIRRLWRGGFYTEARDATWDFVVSLRLPYYFWLGLRGAVGVLAWLAVPIFLMSLGTRVPLIGFAGSFLLMFVLLYVPFLQTRFARDNRFRALFEWWTARAGVPACPGGLCVRAVHHAGAVPAALPGQDPGDSAGVDLAGKLVLRGIDLSGPAADRLGGGPGRPANGAAALDLPLAEPAEHAAGGGVLRLSAVLHAVHRLGRRVEPLRAARFHAAGAVHAVVGAGVEVEALVR